MKIYIAAVSSALLLAACGGGGGGQASFSALESRGIALVEKLESEEVTPVSSMPTSGTATYSGVAGFESDGYEVASEAELTANFGASTIAGSLTNFRDFENTALPGTVAIQSGVISGSEFGANLDGSVTIGGVARPVDGTLNGVFAGTDGGMIAGFIEGTVGGVYTSGLVVAERK